MSRVRLPSVLLCTLSLCSLVPTLSMAQMAPTPLPLAKGTKYSVKLDSSPQQAAIYINDKQYGIQGYTPSTLKLPKGEYRVMLELPGFKPANVPIVVTRSQAFSITLERAPRPAILDLRAGPDQNALGAQIYVDGASVGTVPNQIEVAAGNHLVEVRKQGFNDYRDTVGVTEGERRTLSLAMQQQMHPGTILVTSDVQGMVYLDGVARDNTPTVLNDVPEGAHTIEVRPAGREAQAWKQVITVVAGQQSKVMAQIAPAVVVPPPPMVGSLKILSASPGADVFLDGDPKGPAGVEIKNVAPGSHIVEVRAPNFQPRRQEVGIQAGEMKVVAVDLVPAASVAQTAGLRVISMVPDVDVYIDGAAAGKAPIERNDLAPGDHYVVARHPGLADFTVKVTLAPGKMAEVAADLRASGTLRIITNPAGADIFIDGAPAGKTPSTVREVAVGQHVVELRMKDFLDGKQIVTVQGGVEAIVQLDLQSIQRGPTISDIERTVREQSSWGALTLDRGRFTVDAGVGYPYFVRLRLTTGVARFNQNMALDVGVELRTNFDETDVLLRGRFQFLKYDPFSLAAELSVGGGGGPVDRNGATFEIGPTATISAGQFVHVNFHPYLGVWSDRLCPAVSDIQSDDKTNGVPTAMPKPGSGSLYQTGEKDICKTYDMTRSAASMSNYQLPGLPAAVTATYPTFGQLDPRERFTTVRFMLQASLEIAVTRNLNIWFMVEGAPFQGPRQSFQSPFNPVFPDNDLPLYGAAGITGKF